MFRKVEEIKKKRWEIHSKDTNLEIQIKMSCAQALIVIVKRDSFETGNTGANQDVEPLQHSVAVKNAEWYRWSGQCELAWSLTRRTRFRAESPEVAPHHSVNVRWPLKTCVLRAGCFSEQSTER